MFVLIVYIKSLILFQLKSEAQVLGAENTVLKAELEKHKAYNGKLEVIDFICYSYSSLVPLLKYIKIYSQLFMPRSL